ncbi:MAG TPA: carboxypeptidase regulatory-like domain-containing protein [Chlamydiales bacterium]|nr:carboxypeptidase regulatory-like domain-containing protein [Chlamydiales bacterium]
MKHVFSYLFFFFCACLVPQSVNASGNFAGIVTDSVTGHPISGVLVIANKGNQQRGSTTTDENGTYLFSNLNPSNYTLIASEPGYRTQAIGARLANNETTIVNFALVPTGGTISGTVTNATSVPISGASVEIFQGQTLITTATTDGSGAYSAPDLAPGVYNVVASATGFQTQSQGATVQLGLVTTVSFALIVNPGSISGTVKDSLANPIEGALVEVFDQSILVGFANTDSGGNYTIPNLPPSHYVVVASAEGYQTEAVGAAVTSGMTTTVAFVLAQPVGTIAGTVRDAVTLRPISGATINIFSGVTLITSLLTDPNGQYEVPEFAPGNYTVSATANGYQTQLQGATVAANTTTTVNFALDSDPGTIAGRVTDATTGDPIVGATIRIYTTEILVAAALTDSDGNYEIPNLAPDTYSVTAFKPNYQLGVVGAVVVTAGQTTVVNLALASNPGTISGTVRDSGATPIPGATVIVLQGTTLVNSTLTDVNGSYTVPGLAPGTYTVLAFAQGYRAAFATKTVMAGMTTTSDFNLNSLPGAIAGTVTDGCTGGPSPGTVIVVLNGSAVVGFGVTDSNGSYDIDTLAPGSYTVTAAKNKFVTSTSSATVIANQTTTVNFLLTPAALPPATLSGSTVKDKFLTQTDFVHSIQWEASPGFCVTGYQVFRNGALIAFVSSADLLSYLDHNRYNQTDTYSIKAVNSFDLISSAASITLH